MKISTNAIGIKLFSNNGFRLVRNLCRLITDGKALSNLSPAENILSESEKQMILAILTNVTAEGVECCNAVIASRNFVEYCFNSLSASINATKISAAQLLSNLSLFSPEKLHSTLSKDSDGDDYLKMIIGKDFEFYNPDFGWYFLIICVQIFKVAKNQRGDPWKSKFFVEGG